MLSALARLDPAPARRALSRLVDPFVPRGDHSQAHDGPVAVNPSGTVVREGRVVREGPVRPDWLTHRFGSPLNVEGTAALAGYARGADLVTLLCEVLPAAAALERAGETPPVLLMGLPLARLDATQDALNARLFGRVAVKVHGAHRVARAGALLPLGPPADRDLAEVAARLRAAYGPATRTGGGGTLYLRRSVPAPRDRTRAGEPACAASGCTVLGAEGAALRTLVRALFRAELLVFETERLATLARIRPDCPHSVGRPFRPGEAGPAS